jgi:hypothetical protein
MAFNINNFQKWSQGDALGGNNMWAYVSSTDAIATIVTNGYFNSVNNTFDGVAVSPLIQINDLIWVNCTDYQGYVLVSDTEPTIISSQFQITIGAGAVGTSNLADGAVTTAKLDDDAVTSDKMDPTVLKYAVVSMAAADVLGAYAAPVEILAAPGAGFVIEVESALYVCDYGGAQFAAGGVAALQYDDTVHGGGVLASATTAAAVINAWAADSMLRVGGAMASAAATAVANQGIFFSNDTAAFTTGTSVVDVHIWYRIVPTGL